MPLATRADPMFPSHCKEVSVKTVDFNLTSENIKNYLKGKRAYIRTRYYIFNSGDSWAVSLVVKKLDNEVLQDIASVHILSLPDETAYVEEPSMDVLSASSMGYLRELSGKKCIVVKGKSEHVSFFIEEPPYELTIFDVVPPSPSKLEGLVSVSLDTDLQDKYVKYRTITLDLNQLAKEVRTGTVMFPCRASGLSSERRVLYLDSTPELTQDEIRDVTLIGCSLSARIFKAVYGSEPRLVNMCPKDLLSAQGIRGPALVKCCKVKEGCDVNGDVASVPWGARSSDVTEAMRRLLR